MKIACKKDVMDLRKIIERKMELTVKWVKCFSEIVLKKGKFKHLYIYKICCHQQCQEVIRVNYSRLFSRLIILVERTTEMAPFFDYELTPLPLSLFKHSFMRKLDKVATQ